MFCQNRIVNEISTYKFFIKDKSEYTVITAFNAVNGVEMALDIDRINELARKSKTVGLTEEEKAEQAKLRRAYIDSVVGNLRSQLDNAYTVDENGNEVKITAKKDDFT